MEECDSSRNGIGAILMQEGRIISFESFKIKGKKLHKPIYEKQIVEILYSLKKWCPYIRTLQGKNRS